MSGFSREQQSSGGLKDGVSRQSTPVATLTTILVLIIDRLGEGNGNGTSLPFNYSAARINQQQTRNGTTFVKISDDEI